MENPSLKLTPAIIYDIRNTSKVDDVVLNYKFSIVHPSHGFMSMLFSFLSLHMWGLWNKGYLEMMKNGHKIEPMTSHYAFKVFYVGSRRGQWATGRKHSEFMRKMLTESEAIAWGLVLSACGVH